MHALEGPVRQSEKTLLASASSKVTGQRVKVAPDKVKAKDKKEELRESQKNKRLPSMFSDVITSLKTQKDRKLDKELADLNIRKRNREVEYFLSQRQFFMSTVFTANNEFRFSRFNAKSGNNGRVQSCPSPSVQAESVSQSGSHTVKYPGRAGRPAVNPTVLPGTPRVPTANRRRAALRSSLSHGNMSSKERSLVALRDLLFLNESSAPPTPNRRRIRQARARMFPHQKGFSRPNRTGSSPREDAPASSRGEQEKEEEEGEKEEEGKREVSAGHLIRGKKTIAALDEDTKQHPGEITHLDPNTPDLASAGPGRSGLTTLRCATQLELVTDARLACAARPGFPRSRTSVELSNSEALRARQWLVRSRTTLRPANDVIDVEAQSRLLQRIMLTVPPDVIAKATAHAQNLSDLMGYTQMREMLLLRERCHGDRLGKADDRFTNLMAVLRK